MIGTNDVHWFPAQMHMQTLQFAFQVNTSEIARFGFPQESLHKLIGLGSNERR